MVRSRLIGKSSSKRSVPAFLTHNTLEPNQSPHFDWNPICEKTIRIPTSLELSPLVWLGLTVFTENLLFEFLQRITMKPFAISSVLLAIGLLAGEFLTAIASAETTGWSTGLFSSKTTTTPVGVQEPEPKSWKPDWKMPNVAGSVKKATHSVTSATTNAWNTTSRTTKHAWKKTTEALDPFPDKKPVSATGASDDISQSSKSKSGFSSWFGGKKEDDDRPKTINDFLGQKRL